MHACSPANPRGAGRTGRVVASGSSGGGGGGRGRQGEEEESAWAWEPVCASARPAAFGGCIRHARARCVPHVAFAIARGNSPAKWPHGPGRRLALATRRPPDRAPAQRSGVNKGPSAARRGLMSSFSQGSSGLFSGVAEPNVRIGSLLR